MQNAILPSIRTGLLSLLLLLGSGASLAFAQSGSAGGSIGNDEKSLSGSRQAPRAVESEKPSRKSKPAAEESHRASRSGAASGGGNFDGSWVALANGTPCGSSTERFVVSGGNISGELSSGHVSPDGSTRSGGSASGVSWTSTGHFSERSASGSFVRSDGCTGRWTASKQ